MESGAISVSKASLPAVLPQTEQAQAAAGGPEALVNKARELQQGPRYVGRDVEVGHSAVYAPHLANPAYHQKREVKSGVSGHRGKHRRDESVRQPLLPAGLWPTRLMAQ